MSLTLRVVTLNLLNDLTYWQRRAPMMVDELNTLQPELIALQNVGRPGNTT